MVHTHFHLEINIPAQAKLDMAQGLRFSKALIELKYRNNVVEGAGIV
jgi:hypothetical protein